MFVKWFLMFVVKNNMFNINAVAAHNVSGVPDRFCSKVKKGRQREIDLPAAVKYIIKLF